LTGVNIVTSGVPINISYTANTNQVVSTVSAAYAVRPNLISNEQAVCGGKLTKSASALGGLAHQAATGATLPELK